LINESRTLFVPPAPSEESIATLYGGGASSTFSVEDTVIPKTVLGSSTSRIAWDDKEVMVSGNLFTTSTIVASNAPPIPEVSFKTVVPEPAGNSIVAGAALVAVGMTMVGNAVYRLEHFVGRLGVVIPSFSQEVFSISLFVFLGSAFVPLLLLRDSDFPSGFTTCITARGVSPVFTNFTIRSKEDVKTILLGHPRMVRRNWLRTASA
jgi:hypothetical protein